ncbi:FadR/GntR family transcriptional regulator [Arthrobacter sp. JSM 101049]|uniref:FadR/GntR family transcriptional regulator n=1 Tax=Arthrobacter sp. JSM 101049 TaxID=929097 RepID=UPI003566CD11
MSDAADPPAPRRTYDALLSDIEAGLGSGQLRLGDRLTGERALAEKYGISRASVREAVRILDVMGILQVPTNAGPKSGPVIVSNPSLGFSAALRFHLAAKRLPVADIVETRILLETWAARNAPERAELAGLEEARALLEAMDAPGLDPEEFHGLDARFHVALSRLGGNAVVETLMEALGSSISGYIREAMEAAGGSPEVLDDLKSQHHAIFDAVRDGDRQAAADMIQGHVSWLHDRAR